MPLDDRFQLRLCEAAEVLDCLVYRLKDICELLSQ